MVPVVQRVGTGVLGGWYCCVCRTWLRRFGGAAPGFVFPVAATGVLFPVVRVLPGLFVAEPAHVDLTEVDGPSAVR